MTPQALKASILQLAIQGKLVPQRSEEGTAEDLYQQIQAEKQRLIAEGKIKKEKPLPPIDEDKLPFDIPETWKWVRLHDLSSVISKGTTPRGGNACYSNTGIAFLRAENVTGFDKLDKTNLKFVTEENHHTFLKRSILKSNDILITIAGTLGRTALITESDLPLNANQAVAFIRPIINEKIALKYIIYALNAPEIQQRLLKQKKVTAIPNLTLENIDLCCIPLPSLDEQKRIVAKIEEMLPLIDRYGEAYEQLQAFNKRFPDDLRKSILQEAIQGKLVPQRPEEGTAKDLYQQIQAEKKRLIASGTIKKEKSLPPIEEKDIPFDIPETWKWVRLHDLSSVISKGTTPRGGNACYSNTGIAFLRAENVAGFEKLDKTSLKFVTEENHHTFLKRSILKSNDILITIAGTLGRTALVTENDLPLNANQAVAFIRPIINEKIALKYIIYALNAPEIQQRLLKQKKVTAIPNLTLENIDLCCIPLPSLDEQKRIVAAIEEILALCEHL